MFKTKIQIAAASLVIALQSVLAPIALADFLPVRAYGADTVAGYASKLRTSLINPGQEVIFVVEKPDYSVVRVPSEADLEGIAVADLYGHQTKLAGSYKVAVTYPGSSSSSPQNSFLVYADQVSRTQSQISSTTQMIEADGVSKTYLTVTLYDAYLNPIKNHHVQLISSRQEDNVSELNGGVTDDSGRANFKVTSKYSGVSVFTAMDTTANQVLADREEIVFMQPTRSNEFGGNYLQADIFSIDMLQSASADEVLPGPVFEFEIQDLPSTVKVNEDLTLTVVARDKDGNIAKNYTGTILISTPDDENAVLPNNGEYTFKEADQGQFTFNLALRFTQVGDQYIQILDKDNWKISGEKQVEVVPEQAITVPDVSATLVIKSPVDGGKFGSNLVIVSGQGDPNINLKVFDNDIKIGDSETDGDGFFTYQAQNLSPGSHEFYVMSTDGKVSKSVSIEVDTLPPVLNFINVIPDGSVLPGEALSVSVSSEPGLDEARVRLQGIEKDLAESTGQPGTYTTTLAAPAISGSFPMDVILVDNLANKAELLNQKTIIVQEIQAVKPPQVQNPEGVPGASQVELSWDEVTGHESDIQNYRVYYGTAFDELDQMIETDDDATSITINELENGTQYFFAVAAIDSKGEESEERSVTIAATPVSTEPEEIDLEGEGEEEPDEVSGIDTGQFPGGLMPGQLPPASLYNNPVIGSATSNTVTLNWQPFPGVTAFYYKIYFGFQSGAYDDYVITPATSTSFAIKDLINGIPYYFAVVALDMNGNEISPLSAEFMMIPSGAGFHPAPPSQVDVGAVQPTYLPVVNGQLAKVPATDETGPEALWLILISVTVAFILYRYRRRVLKSN